MVELEVFEKGLRILAEGTRLSLETLSVLCVLVGLLATLRRTSMMRRQLRHSSDLPFTKIRLGFGAWLSLALEFQLGADIVATTTTPNTVNLIQLGVVALIRTFLNFFLAREMEMEHRMETQARSAQDNTPT
ncbi:DUF1622 domain-containing protein [Synechococcus elongatus]|uniref:DUF1622 domain-containing protein n=2 Tax=Synechococcus elongatus TaxID=32046 RepID=A0AAN1QNR8_SYNEL|nr:DUF1622 domain-containing protein [Synechococcus elongatus]AZB72754.1 hypothetical protein DOP62_08550 [Synechococcus elongatus PCC 11801]QFZ92601.1 DUF1622 domain-containing protein [Synechococcus elongatus PCC 11802]